MKATYMPLAKISRYTSLERHETPKRDYVHSFEKMKKHVDFSGSGSLIDLGCASGDFLYYIKRNSGPGWELYGVDTTQEFIDAGKSFPGLQSVNLFQGDMLALENQYDVLTCQGTIPIFTDIEDVLGKLLKSTKDGGWLFLTGLFNEFDVDVIFNFHDHSTEDGTGKWRCDFNIHSQKRIRKFLDGKVKYYDFIPLEMDIDIPQNLDNPHIRVFTKTLGNGARIKINGGMLIIDTWLLTIQKLT